MFYPLVGLVYLIITLIFASAGHSGNYTKELYGRTSCVRPGQYNGLLYCGDAVRTVGEYAAPICFL